MRPTLQLKQKRGNHFFLLVQPRPRTGLLGKVGREEGVGLGEER